MEKAAQELETSMYEPEEFPGLIYWMKEPKATILLFLSGKFVCAGAKREGDVPIVVKRLKRELQERGLITPL